MKDKQKVELNKKIKNEIETLKRTVEELKETIDPVAPDDAIGRLSRLDTMLNQGINKSSISQSLDRIMKLGNALIRIDEDPFFGECQECGEQIPFARLIALPESRFCVDCAE